MKNFIFITVLGLLATTAQAEHNYPYPYPNPYAVGQYTGVCSVSATDGRWAVYYNQSTDLACYNAKNALYRSGRNTFINTTRRSYFNAYQYVRVFVRCQEASDIFRGYGLEALNQAYLWAKYSGYNSCIFRAGNRIL